MNLDRPEMAYQVLSGAPTITYVFLAPLASLASFDEVLARVPQYARAAAKVAAAGNLSQTEKPALPRGAVDQYRGDDIAGRDPEFWRPPGNGSWLPLPRNLHHRARLPFARGDDRLPISPVADTLHLEAKADGDLGERLPPR